LLGFPGFTKLFQRIEKGIPYLEDNYFQQGEFKDLAAQRNRFDKALLDPKKTVKKKESKPSPPPRNEPTPKPPKPEPSKESSSSDSYTVKMLNEVTEKRHMYLRSVFRDEDDIYEIQSRYIEYEHQIRRIQNNINKIIDVQDDKDGKQQNAIIKIYDELDYWNPIQKYNVEEGFTDFKNLESTPIENIRNRINDIIVKESFPEKPSYFQSRKNLEQRGNSVMGDEHLPKSILQDKSFIRKKDHIRTLRSKNVPVISKKVENEVENVPEIHVKPSDEIEEKIKENKEEIEKIGEDYGEQVSQINVEEDSEIEYNLENINGK
jgi:hypothetical protein